MQCNTPTVTLLCTSFARNLFVYKPRIKHFNLQHSPLHVGAHPIISGFSWIKLYGFVQFKDEFVQYKLAEKVKATEMYCLRVNRTSVKTLKVQIKL